MKRSFRGVMHTSMKAGALLAVAFLATSCLSRSPGVRFYTLAPVTGWVVEGAAKSAIRIGPIVLPRYLSRPQIVTRDGENEIRIDAYSRWAGGLEFVILNVLATNVSQRLDTERVVLSTSEPPFPIVYSVTFEFNELVRKEKRLVMDVRWTILDADDEVLMVESSVIGVDAAKKVSGTIRAHEEVLAELADAVAEQISAIVRSKTATGQYGAPIDATP